MYFRVSSVSPGWCSRTARCVHVAGFDTRVRLCHGRMGSPSGVRCRRLLDIHTWLDRYSSRNELFPSVMVGWVAPFSVCCRQLLDVHMWSIYNSRCFFCVMVGWVASPSGTCCRHPCIFLWRTLYVFCVCVCVCHPERAVQ